jgi:hypothetical protein
MDRRTLPTPRLTGTAPGETRHRRPDSGDFVGFLDLNDILHAFLGLINVRELTDENRAFRLRTAGGRRGPGSARGGGPPRGRPSNPAGCFARPSRHVPKRTPARPALRTQRPKPATPPGLQLERMPLSKVVTGLDGALVFK